MTTTILEQRAIEAAFAKPLFEAMVAEIGVEAARRILSKAVIAAARQAGADLAARTGGPSDLRAFAELLTLWQQDDALVIDWLKVEPNRLDFNVTRCRYAETYRALGVADIGGLLSCNRDGEFCCGYDPRMSLTRTQTIMDGDSHCDFRYSLLEERS
jgi:hypothetical protein